MQNLLFEPTKHNVEEDVFLREYIKKELEDPRLLEARIECFINAYVERALKREFMEGARADACYDMEKIKRFYFEAGMAYMRDNLERYEGHEYDKFCYCAQCGNK